MIVAITAFIPIPGHPRSQVEYEYFGEQLRDTGIPLLRMDGSLEQCWLWRYLKDKEYTWSTADNPAKNTIAYHCVMAQKSEILAIASELPHNADVLAWIDFGIFHIPGITAEIIREFMARAEDEQAIAIPGCWDRNYEYDDRFPMWRWCGGLIVMPRKYATAFDAAMKDEYKSWLRKTGNVSWEVNTLARLEQQGTALPLWHFRADHDASIFSAYRPVTAQVQ